MRLSLRRLAPYGYGFGGGAVTTALDGLVRGPFPARPGPAAALAYDFFFVPPPGTLAVRGPDELLGLVLLLAAALVTGQLAASLRRASARSAAAAEEATALYQLATAALRLPEVNAAIGLLAQRALALA